MEVHKHPHHVTHKKKWTEYLLEFFMLFLAVFLGFVAENVRENVVERNRAREFAVSMIKDLREDTSVLRRYKNSYMQVAANTDTLMQLLSAAEPKDVPSGKLYWYGTYAGSSLFHYVSNDATFQQMKSSGTLRYFKDSVAKLVQRYDRLNRLLQSYEGNQQQLFAEIRSIRAQLFYFNYLEIGNRFAFSRGTYAQIDSFIKTNPPLLKNDKLLFNEFVELARSRFLRSNVQVADTLLIQGSILINQLRLSYNIND